MMCLNALCCNEQRSLKPWLLEYPVTFGHCIAEGDKAALDQLAALLLLISPFFFWGTSMVAFKASNVPLLLV